MNCCCSDQLCPVCQGKCQVKATTVLTLFYDLDNEPLFFCKSCADNATETGMFEYIDSL
jgi:hypothetical protein